MNEELQIEEVDPGHELVAHVTDMVRVHRTELPPIASWPSELEELAGGLFPRHCMAFVGIEANGPCGMVVVAARGERGAELMGLYVRKEVRGRYIGLTLTHYAIEIVYLARRFTLEVDVSNCVQGAIGVFQQLDFVFEGVRATRDYLTIETSELPIMQGDCLRSGWGDWSVVLFNDEHTTMDVVLDALSNVFGLAPDAATRVMYLTHFSGRAPVWRYTNERDAQLAAGRLMQAFRHAGFATQVDVMPVAVLDKPTLRPATWPAD